MIEEIDSLELEIINVQALDGYLKDGMIRNGSYFHRPEYKYDMEKYKNLFKPYEIANRFTVVGKEQEEDVDDEYTFDDVLKELTASIDIYNIIYNLNEVVVDNKEWELFFETICDYYCEHGLENFFMEDMLALNRYALARSLVYEDECIDLETYIKSFKYIESNILSINNIVELAEKVSEVLSIDAVAILANEDGSFGCKNKNSSIFLVDDDIDVEKEEVLKEYLEKNGYKVADIADVIEEKQNVCEGNVISFDEKKLKRKNKIVDITTRRQ